VKHLSELEDRFDVVVCGKNATRHRVNALRRKQRNYTDLLHVGETVLCLANNSEFGVFNGMTFTVKTVHKTGLLTDVGTIYADLVDDAGQTYLDIPIRREFFGKNYKRDFDKSAIPFDYGYCLTAHKSQGSEFDNVLVIDEPLYGGDTCRWRYTAATRAAKNLTYAL
jgi:exodeoxyribonuclease-5